MELTEHAPGLRERADDTRPDGAPSQSRARFGAAVTPRPTAIHLTLRVKGVIAVLVLLTYLALIGIFVRSERASLVSIVQELERNQSALAMLDPAVGGLANALVATQALLNAQESRAAQHPGSLPVLNNLRLEQLNLALEHVRTSFPTLDDDISQFRQAVGSVLGQPSGEHLAQMRDSAQVLLVDLQDAMRTVQRDSETLARRYQAKQQFLSVFAISANVLGAVASVAVILVFFTRLARDIDRLQNRAAAIVGGYDGAPLPNTRGDEVGGLIDAVNRMQVDLRNSERQQELTRQQRFHQEKMAAVGSVASAIGHEVRNPIAAISGIAQFIVDENASEQGPQAKQIGDFGRQILTQTERISHILRQLAALTAPHSPDPELLDINALVRSTCGFIRYDKRFHAIRFVNDLDPALPAVTAVSDHITQILMNLLINAADALDGLTPSGGCTIRVATVSDGDEIRLSVTDNGRGMTPDVLARAFEEAFTTKPAGHGCGIGLFLCKSLIEKGGGRIELQSTPGNGATATVCIPRTGAGQRAS